MALEFGSGEEAPEMMDDADGSLVSSSIFSQATVPVWGGGLDAFGEATNAVRNLGGSQSHYGVASPNPDGTISYTPYGSTKSSNITPQVKAAIDYFKAKGWSTEQASGIVALLVAKNGLDTSSGINLAGIPKDKFDKLVEAYEHDSNRDKDAAETPFNEALGIIQYDLTHGDGAKIGTKLKAATSAADSGAAITEYYGAPASVDAAKASQIDASGFSPIKAAMASHNIVTGPDSWCFQHVNDALLAGGLDIRPYLTRKPIPWAKDAAPVLQKLGWTVVAQGYGADIDQKANYHPELGDVAVWLGGPCGHIEIRGVSREDSSKGAWQFGYESSEAKWTGLKDPNSHGQFVILRHPQSPTASVIAKASELSSDYASSKTEQAPSVRADLRAVSSGASGASNVVYFNWQQGRIIMPSGHTYDGGSGRGDGHNSPEHSNDSQGYNHSMLPPGIYALRDLGHVIRHGLDYGYVIDNIPQFATHRDGDHAPGTDIGTWSHRQLDHSGHLTSHGCLVLSPDQMQAYYSEVSAMLKNGPVTLIVASTPEIEARIGSQHIATASKTPDVVATPTKAAKVQTSIEAPSVSMKNINAELASSANDPDAVDPKKKAPENKGTQQSVPA